jgi:hypothetical protein
MISVIDPIWLIKHLLWVVGLATLLGVGGYALYRGGSSQTMKTCAYVGLVLAGTGLSLTLTTWWLRGLWAIVAVASFVSLIRRIWLSVSDSRARQRALIFDRHSVASMKPDDRGERHASRQQQTEHPERHTAQTTQSQ